MDNQKKASFLVLLISLVLAFAGCTGTNDKKVDIPETDRIDSIELQFSDDSCTVSKIVSIDGKDKDTITELIRTTCKKWRKSVNDNPQEVPYVIVNFHTGNQDIQGSVLFCIVRKHRFRYGAGHGVFRIQTWQGI